MFSGNRVFCDNAVYRNYLNSRFCGTSQLACENRIRRVVYSELTGPLHLNDKYHVSLISVVESLYQLTEMLCSSGRRCIGKQGNTVRLKSYALYLNECTPVTVTDEDVKS